MTKNPDTSRAPRRLLTDKQATFQTLPHDPNLITDPSSLTTQQ
jgi:hypothetical protein